MRLKWLLAILKKPQSFYINKFALKFEEPSNFNSRWENFSDHNGRESYFKPVTKKAFEENSEERWLLTVSDIDKRSLITGVMSFLRIFVVNILTSHILTLSNFQLTNSVLNSRDVGSRYYFRVNNQTLVYIRIFFRILVGQTSGRLSSV